MYLLYTNVYDTKDKAMPTMAEFGGMLMKCPYCGFIEDKVIDSRPTDEGSAIRRRRECSKCTRRFTTYEKVESLPLMIIKKDKSRQPYNREKLLNGLLRACEKRPVSINDLEKLVDEIESYLYNSLQREITSKDIGEMVISRLKELDEVAYVRFASVYRQFKDINTFMDELHKLLEEKYDGPAERRADKTKKIRDIMG